MTLGVSTTITSRSAATALWILTGLAGAMFLRTASELLIPIVIAVLISYALEPLVRWLERAKIPRLLGAGMLLFALVAGATRGLYALRQDIGEAATAVPEATRRLGDWLGMGTTAQQAECAIRSPEFVQRGAGWIVSGAGHLTVVVFLTYFLLISGAHFKRRFTELPGHHLERRRITLDVLDDINDQIQLFSSCRHSARSWSAPRHRLHLR
jgi:predicted PurR-regulated permease PerM